MLYFVQSALSGDPTELVHQVERLDPRYEVVGKHEPQFRVLPARQRLNAGDVAGRDVDLRLVVQNKLSPFKGLIKVLVRDFELGFLMMMCLRRLRNQVRTKKILEL